jgi:Eco57I restriction-modification methylase
MSNRFACLTIEGSLIGADVIDQIADGKAQGQKPADFYLDLRHLTDEIAAAWTDARAFWSSFQRQLGHPNKNETTLTRDQWLIPLFRLLGYELTYSPKAAEVDGVTYAVSHRAGADENAPPIHLVGRQQELHLRAESGRPRLSPHALMQEYLNRTEHVWGVIANGHALRLLRNSQLIRRQSYIEFDLRQMMEAGKFPDFALLFRLLHRTRLPRGMDHDKSCLLELYHQQTIEQGGRVRERLRDGVEQAIKLFANAFLRHSKNQPLRERLGSGHFKAEDFYRQLLRLIYRLLFLMVAEERDLLEAGADSDVRVYRENYGVERLRKQLQVRAAANEYEDLWLGLQSLFSIFQDEKLAAVLNVSPLNGDLFDTSLTPLLTNTRISNRDLLSALESLALYRPTAHSSLQRVNYAAIDVEELGSVYESLLDYHPVITSQHGRLTFDFAKGTERKSTGSYYTPPELVNELIESALVPVINDRLSKAKTKDEQAHAILNIKVCDPACGSGHFLLAAARRLGLELARIRSGEQEPTPEERREATRDVIGECIYGVDKNPLAVDLCKVALWIEGNSRSKPLKFIDHRLRLGDSLVGVFDLSVLTGGIPDEVFEPVSGDDKETARELKRRNRDERGRNEDELSLPFDPEMELRARANERREMLKIRDDSVAEANRKKTLFRRLRESEQCCIEQTASNLWTGAFFVDLTVENLAQCCVPTTAALNDYLKNHKAVDARLVSLTEPLANRLRFFHWPLEFPEVFEEGGFDVVLGNPPWERVKLQEQEFFAERDLEIAGAPNKAARNKLIRQLRGSNQALWQEYMQALHDADSSSKFFRKSKRFPLGAHGEVNTFAVFTELALSLLNSRGQTGIIVPTAVATSDTTKNLFASIIRNRSLVTLIDFLEARDFFEGLESRDPFCLLVMRSREQTVVDDPIRFAFKLLSLEELALKERHVLLSSDDFELFNPNTHTCPSFRTNTDAELTRKIYQRVPILLKEQNKDGGKIEENPWNVTFSTMFHMSGASELFRNRTEMEKEGFTLQGNQFRRTEELFLPLYEAKMIWQFDHRYGSYDGITDRSNTQLPTPNVEKYSDPHFFARPWYWISFREVMLRSSRVPEALMKAYRMGNRELIFKAILYWLAGYHYNRGNEQLGQEAIIRSIGFDMSDSAFANASRQFLASLFAPGVEEEYQLTDTDIKLIKKMAEQKLDAIEMAEALIKHRTPKWLIGFRKTARPNDERTAILSVIPLVGVGDKAPLLFFRKNAAYEVTCFIANYNSIVFDYVTRQKIGGTDLSHFYVKQLPVLPPSTYSLADIEFIAPRVLELVYTSYDLKAFAEDWGYDGPPFKWNEERRSILRADLDAYFAGLYGLTRDELRYILDPKDVCGPDFPSETFRVLKEKEGARYGEYRTRRLTLEAWDKLAGAK